MKNQKIVWDTAQNPAWRAILGAHGWRQSQANGSWHREHPNRKTEIVGGPYIPHYEREVRKCVKMSRQILGLFYDSFLPSEHRSFVKR